MNRTQNNFQFYIRIYISPGKISYYDEQFGMSLTIDFVHRKYFLFLYLFILFGLLFSHYQYGINIKNFVWFTSFLYLILDFIFLFRNLEIEIGERGYPKYDKIKYFKKVNFVGLVNVFVAALLFSSFF